MAGTASHIDVASPSSRESGSQAGREFFQERLGIFARWNCLLSLGFIPLRIVGELVLDPALSFARVMAAPSMVVHVGASATAGVVWLVVRRRSWSTRALQALDAGMTFCIGALFAAMGAILARGGSKLVEDPRAAMLAATLAVSLTMMWHAVAVPSPPRRSAAVTGLGILPLITADVIALGGTTPASVVAQVFAAGWAVLALVAAVVSSDIVHGLRRAVQKARRLGQYTLEEKIGEGAMGVVYRASHTMLRRPTAIKLLPPNRVGTIDLRRFEREVQLTAMLTHPNTVAIYDYGRTPDGVFYYAMEFLDGINLEDLVRRHGPQPAGRVIHILRQVCRALTEAHSLGLIHRDIKPANVILTTRGGVPDVAKVVDFGLVKNIDPAGVDSTMTTSVEHVLVGTPMYFAPETISAPNQSESRSDLYSLGAVGYFLVTGQPLFDARTIMEVCILHLQTMPVPPSVRLGRPVDSRLESILLQCLAKTPAERPASARALDEALGTCASALKWTNEEALEWWAEYGDVARPDPAETAETGPLTVAVDLAAR